MSSIKEQKEFISFLDFYDVGLDNINLKEYMTKLAEFTNFRAQRNYENESLEKVFIK